MQLDEEEELVAQMAFNSVVQKILTNESGTHEFPQEFQSRASKETTSRDIPFYIPPSTELSPSTSSVLPSPEIQYNNGNQWNAPSMSNPFIHGSNMNANDLPSMNKNNVLGTNPYLSFQSPFSNSIPTSENGYNPFFRSWNRQNLPQSVMLQNIYHKMTVQSGVHQILQGNYGLSSNTGTNNAQLDNATISLFGSDVSREGNGNAQSIPNASLNQSLITPSNFIHRCQSPDDKETEHSNPETRREKRSRGEAFEYPANQEFPNSHNLNHPSSLINLDRPQPPPPPLQQQQSILGNNKSSDISISMSDSGTGDENLKLIRSNSETLKSGGDLKNDERGKKLRRMKSNRDSARRSRLKRQQRLEELEITAAQLRVENASLAKKAKDAIEKANKTEAESLALKKAFEELKRELKEYQSDEVDSARESTKQESTNSVGARTGDKSSEACDE